jgi:hypothetical protein
MDVLTPGLTFEDIEREGAIAQAWERMAMGRTPELRDRTMRHARHLQSQRSAAAVEAMERATCLELTA